MGLDHSLFRCYGYQQINQCSPYAWDLCLRLNHLGVDHRRIIYRTRPVNPTNYHAIVWFTIGGKEYMMDNEHYSPVEVRGSNVVQKIQMFSTGGFWYLPKQPELDELGDYFFDDLKVYKKVMDSFDKYKKVVYLVPSVKHD